MVEPLEADTLAAEPLVAEPMSDNALDGGSLDAAPLGGDTLEAAPLQAGLETPSLETGLPELEPSLDSGLSAEPVAPAVMAAASGSQVGDEENKSRVELKPASQRTGAGIVGYQKIQQLKVKVQAMLGTVPLTVAELANLEQGDLVTLDTKIGDPIEILANGELIARAEIAVTDDPKPRFGLKLTEIVDSNEGQ
jgi:flagellar motor switch protein FliN/FliY